MTGEEIRMLRKDLGNWSQKKLASTLGVARYTVNRWEAGIRKPLPIFDKMLTELKDGKYEL